VEICITVFMELHFQIKNKFITLFELCFLIVCSLIRYLILKLKILNINRMGLQKLNKSR